jgi:hypothetical protein
MRFYFDAEPAADPNQPLAPPRPDLLASYSYHMIIDHAARHVTVSGFVRNIGNVPIRKPFTIALGVAVTQETTTIGETIWSAQ